MPIGAHHIESGLLLREDRQLVLRIDGGGRWRLDAPLSADRLLGRRVTVDARRDGFDLLGVDAIWLEGEPRPKPRSFVASWKLVAGFALPFALMVIALLAS